MSDDAEKMDALVQWIREVHEREADGCKGSCSLQSVGRHYDRYDERLLRGTYWFCTFGGYCLGDLGRHEEVRAETLDELVVKVKALIEGALARDAHPNWPNVPEEMVRKTEDWEGMG